MLLAVTVVVLLAVVIIFIAPQIDLELGVLRAEQALYALLLAMASIVTIQITRMAGQALPSTPVSLLFALANPAPPLVIQGLLC